ncbi:MAG: class I SAM-dependent methyltransferase, partial [Promethearchaeota archaeon]
MIKTQDLNDKLIMQILEKYKPGKLFDYGCGNGNLSINISKLDFEVVGFDINDSLIMKQKEKNRNILFLTLNEFLIEKLKFKEFFDYLLCSLVVCEVEDNKE